MAPCRVNVRNVLCCAGCAVGVLSKQYLRQKGTWRPLVAADIPQHFRHFRPLAGVPLFLVRMEVTILFSNSGKKGMPFLYGDFHLEGSFGFLFRLL